MSETKAEYQARMGRKFDRLSAETTRLINENQALRKELAALKGDQVPYTYLVEVETQGGFCSKTECHAEYPGAVPVYDRPQKPVVLPEPDVYEVNGTRFYDRLKESDVIAAIEAAGGKVAE